MQSARMLRLVGERNAGVDVEHLGARLDLRDRVGDDAAVVTGRHLGGEQLAPRRIDALADHHEAALEADDDFLLVRGEKRVGHGTMDPCERRLRRAASQGWGRSRSIMARQRFDGLQLGNEVAPPRRAAFQHAGVVDDFGDVLFLPVGHHMHAGDARRVAQLLDHLDADALALGFLVGRAARRAITESGMCTPATLARIQRAALAEASGPTPTRTKHFSTSPRSRALAMKLLQQRQIETILRLDELRAGGDLLGEPSHAKVVRRREGIFRRAEKDARRRRQLAPREKLRFVAHAPDDRQQRDRIEIEDRLGFGMVAALHAVAGQAQNVADAERRGAQHGALDGDAIVVAAGNLHHRGIADPRQQGANRDARHMAMRA